jgi:NTE family protein
VRDQRKAVQTLLSADHLLASSALPFIFPAMPLPMDGHLEHFGDGSMRQTAPLAPAIHLGASKLLVVGAGRRHEPVSSQPQVDASYPTWPRWPGTRCPAFFWTRWLWT